MKKEQIIYYCDEENEDFFSSGTEYNRIVIDENYNYRPKSKVKKVCDFCLYHFLAKPVLSVFMYFVKGVKIQGRKNLKPLKDKGYILYGNHTHYIDAFIGPIGVTRDKRTYIVSNKNAVQIPVVGVLVKSLGGLPVPETIGGLKNLNNTVSKILKEKKVIIIFPEAHIWPYYTGLRPFPISSFKFAAKNKVPAVPIATTYKKRAGIFNKNKKPKMVVWIGEPIYYNEELTEKENAEVFRKKSYEFIKSKIDNSDNYSYIKYVKLEKKEPENEDSVCNS